MEFRGFANLEAAHRKGGFAGAASRHFPGRRPYLYTQNMYKYALLRKHYSGYRRKKIKDEKNELFQHQMYHKNLSENLR